MYKLSAAQMERLLKAIADYNSAIEGATASVKPLSTSAEEELPRITTARRYNERVKQLERATKSGAMDTVTRYGIEVTRYQRQEVKYILRQRDIQQAQARLKYFPNWEEMTTPEKYEAYANRDYAPLYEEDYYSEEMFNRLLDEYYPDMDKKTQAYINVLMDNYDDPELAAKIMEMYAEYPEEFELLMKSPDEEKEVEYVYPDEWNTGRKGSFSGYDYKRGSAFHESAILRVNNVYAYWDKHYNNFKAGLGYVKD